MSNLSNDDLFPQSRIDYDLIRKVIEGYKRKSTLELNTDKFNVINELGIVDLCSGDTLIMKNSHIDKLYWHDESFYKLSEIKISKIRRGGVAFYSTYQKRNLDMGFIIRREEYSGDIILVLKSDDNKEIRMELGNKISPISQ